MQQPTSAPSGTESVFGALTLRPKHRPLRIYASSCFPLCGSAKITFIFDHYRERFIYFVSLRKVLKVLLHCT